MDIDAKNPKISLEGDKENGSEQDAEADDNDDSDVSNDNNDSDEEETDEAARTDEEARLQHEEDCRMKASKGQEKQARRVNASRSNDYKEILEVGNICLIRIEGMIKAATDKGAICVKVTRVWPYTSQRSGGISYRCQVCKRDGYIDKLQIRITLEYQEQELTTEIMGIDETKSKI